MTDLHIHTSFSHDSEEDMEKYIERALALGKRAVGFSDHYDYLCIENGRQIALPDLDEYTCTIARLREKYKGRIEVLCGLEVGFLDVANEKYVELARKYPFDYFINSVHMVAGKDCYHNEFGRNLTAKEAYRLYFAAVRRSIDAPYPYEAVGHIGYASRYTTYEDKKIRYADFAGELDDILRAIIGRGVCLEINTSSAGSGGDFLPDRDIVRRYAELGGRKITFASDAHTVRRYAEKEEIVKSFLKELGIGETYYFKNRKPVAEKL